MRAFAAFVLVAGLASFPVFADCVEPPPIGNPPDGASATSDVMLSAIRAMKAYDAAVTEYTNCLTQTNGSHMKINGAVDKLQRVAEKYNSELRAFKAKSAS